MQQLSMQILSEPIKTYPIFIAEQILLRVEEWLPKDYQEKRIVIMTDETVNVLYAQQLSHALQSCEPLLLLIPPGESAKSYQTKIALETKMLAANCGRDTLILALGGGVVGDLAGFIAATYLRGVPYIQIPTTLLAMVDSSIGGKTAINMPQGKNLIGAFWQPSAVIIDINCLKTLPKQELINGLIEAIKVLLIQDANYFFTLNKTIDSILALDHVQLRQLIERAIKIKMVIVNQDEKENGLRMTLNFGHTIGHAIETISAYEILHGYAVALGILVEAKISVLQGVLSVEDEQIIQTLFAKMNIVGAQLKEMSLDKIIAATLQDKKNKSGEVRYVLLNKIGEVYKTKNNYVHPITHDVVKQALLAVSEVLDGRQ